ncbi:MAG TPA: ROK family protein [Polyangia bacterium]
MADNSLVIGFDLGGTKMHAAAVDAHGHVVHSERCKTVAAEGADAVIDRMIGLCTRILAELGARAPDVGAICVGVPGGVDDERGIVDTAPNLGWSQVPLVERLSSALGMKVFLDNDVRVAVVGEHAYGVGKGTRTMVGVFVGTGIGGGIIVGHHTHHGGRGVAGEIGHMTLLPHGPRCGCGKRGCVEALASRTAMEREARRLIKKGWDSKIPKLMKKADTETLTSSVIERALDVDDDVMRKVLKDAQYYLGLLAGNLANALDPEVIVVGGGIAERLGERFVAPIREHAYKHFLVQRDREKVRIVATELKDLAAPLGAAFLARERLHGRLDSAPGPRHGTASWPVPSA